MSSPAPITPFRRAWLRWKSLKLPWRKRFLVGLDLQGNTFWEFRDTLSSHQHRMRRIVQYPPTVQYSDLNISPQWHQWLRHTRVDPPSLTEQSQDLVRQRNLKVLAAQADRRWAEKPNFLDKPGMGRGQPSPALQVKDPGGYVRSPVDAGEEQGVKSAVGGGLEDKVEGTERTLGELAAVEAGTKEKEEIVKQVPDHKRHHFNERINGERLVEKKIEDPWKKARAGSSEGWQPAAWDPGNASVRR